MRAKLFAIFAILWLILIGGAFWEQVGEVNRLASTIAFRQADMFCQHIMAMWRWGSAHGGVYLAVSPDLQPSTYPNMPNRELVTSDGRRLALINPSRMTSELSALEERQSGLHFHAVSHKPINPDNKPDPWESSALLAFAQGETVAKELSEVSGRPVYRYMAPLRFEESCMSCHEAEHARLGEVAGGISISIPYAGVEGFVAGRVGSLRLMHGVIAIVGLIALLGSYLVQSKLSRRLLKTKNHLQLAYLDALTLLPNRRYYDAFVKREWKRAGRHGYPLSMIMIDIDYFKAYNDSLGHPEGDQCLRQVARILRRYFRRPSDLIARYGGEEFCVVAACDEEQIGQLADILRMAVETLQLPHPNSKISKYVTVSLGVATLIPVEGSEAEQLLHNADQALYIAKQQGRNRVVRYDSIMVDDLLLP